MIIFLIILVCVSIILNVTLSLLIMAKVSDLQPRLDALASQLTKVEGEVASVSADLNQQIADLRAIIENSNDPDLPAAVEAKLAEVEASVARLDALKADTPPTEEPTEPEEPANP